MRTTFTAALMTSVLLAGGLPEGSPVRTATAGAYFTRLRGNEALGLNPANLGYSERFPVGDLTRGTSDHLSREDEATGAATALADHYSVQLMASPNRRLVRRIKQAFQRQYGRAIPAAIMVVDSLYKLRVGDFADRERAETFRESLVAAGYSDAWIVTEDHPLAAAGAGPHFTMTLTGVSLDAGNNAIYPSWINQQLYGGLDLREPGKKDDFLSVFPDDVWNLNLIASMRSLSFSVDNFGMSIIAPRVMSTVHLPTALMDVLFRGVRFDQPRDLSDLHMNLLAAAPISVAYGRQLRWPWLAGTVDQLYAGAGVNLLLGLADAHLTADELYVITTVDSTLIAGRTRVVSNADRESSSFHALGVGLSVDLGMVAEITPQLGISVALKDLFGHIVWPERYTTVNEFSFRLSSEDIENIAGDYEEQLDSLKDSYAESDTTYAIGSGRTVYPSQFILGASCQVSPELTVDAAFIHYLDNDYLEYAAPQLSLGIEYLPSPAFPVYAGIGLGGRDGIKWGTGFGLSMGSFQWLLGFGQQGGVFNSAKGVRFSTEFRLVF
ncbi:MAG: SPOR domain-containing protein [Fidelibacterota bacterium]|nr:MAG: SPOR domain-containing protein [Candidatus Neomarinimicrobiota bacterium]